MTRKHIALAILAHVDAGKTTLGEYMLWRTGAVRGRGSVDRGDTHLDTDDEERARGITIYASQARFSFGNTDFTLIDTPGHADFTPEAVRMLAAADCAVLVVSAPAGVQGHTRRLARLLETLRIPTAVFVNKCDLPSPPKAALLTELAELGPTAEFTGFAGSSFPEALRDALCMQDDALLEAYLSDRADGVRCMEAAGRLFRERRVLPVLFGSARDGAGCDELLTLLDRLSEPVFVQGGPEAAASGVCCKVQYSKGTRYCICRLASGTLRVRDTVTGTDKVSELRVPEGARAGAVPEVRAGDLFAAAGLPLHAGEGFGGYVPRALPDTTAALTARVRAGGPVRTLLEALTVLADEEPSIRVRYEESLSQVSVEVCGEIQLEALQYRLEKRFGIRAEFSEPQALLRETLAAPVIGRGHYEPLRHYAEVHLQLTPAPRGEGITFTSAVHTDVLERSWQNLIRTHVLERVPKGVLTGSALTDVRVTLLAARAHEKHTEGGDFRQAVYRAIRQGLLKGESVLLEPWAAFTAETPSETGGRVQAELTRRGAVCAAEPLGSRLRITGRAPLQRLFGLSVTLASMTRGQATLEQAFDGYEPAQNAAALIAERGYDPLRDPEEDGSSIFCAHGAGFNVPWNEADRYMHLESHLL